MKYIGKASKFYTLWEVYSETRQSLRGNTYKVTHHQYIKNISFDKEIALSKYPDAVLDEDLHGHSSWTSVDYPEIPSDEFKTGKYRGQKIAECTDYSYLLWAFDYGYIIAPEMRPMVEGMLTSQGYRRINESKIVTPEIAQQIEDSFTECESYEEAIEKEGKLTITCPGNLTEEGSIKIGNLTLIFPNCKTIDYYDYYYCLPLDSNGKGKRIKGKTLEIIPESYKTEISEYGWGASFEIVVKDFKIVK